MIQFFNDNLIALVTALSGLLAWGYERNKRKQELLKAKADVAKSDIENTASIINLYKEALEDFKIKNNERFKELEHEIDTLKQRLAGREQEYNKLKKEFMEYKKRHA